MSAKAIIAKKTGKPDEVEMSPEAWEEYRSAEEHPIQRVTHFHGNHYSGGRKVVVSCVKNDPLLKLLQEYTGISKEDIKGHSDIAPGRKTDPGILFDWDRYLSNV